MVDLLQSDPSEGLDDDAIQIVIAPDSAGDRLDRVLAAHLPDVSRARIQALMAQGALMFEGKIVSDVSAKARAGTYVLVVPAPIAALPAPENLPLMVLFEDAHLIVIDKAAGMAAHPAPGTPNGTLVNALLFHCADSLSGIGGVARPGIVHRLDKDTSGVMVAAKSDAAHAGLSALFAAHDLDRVYTALVRGVPEPQGGLICTQIGRSPTDRKKMAVLKEGGREAITRYQVEETFGPAAKPHAARISCRLETGRTHQIRVHMAHKGTPCLADPVYGGGPPSLARSASAQFARMAGGVPQGPIGRALLGLCDRFEPTARPGLACQCIEPQTPRRASTAEKRAHRQ